MKPSKASFQLQEHSTGGLDVRYQQGLILGQFSNFLFLEKFLFLIFVLRNVTQRDVQLCKGMMLPNEPCLLVFLSCYSRPLESGMDLRFALSSGI